MPLSVEDKLKELEDIKQVQSKAQDLYQQYVGSEAQVPSLLKSELNKRLDYSAPLIKEEARLREQKTTTPTAYAAELKSGRFAGNPILAGQAAAQREASIQRRLDEVAGMRRERQGTISDVIQSATGMYQARTAAAGAAADAASRRYSQTFGEYQQATAEQAASEEVSPIDLGNRIAFVNSKGEVVRSEAKGLAPSRGGGGSGGISKSQIDKYKKDALSILQDPNLSENPDERSTGKSDRFLSEAEQKSAVQRFADSTGFDIEDAYQIVSQAFAQGGFETWTGSEAQLKEAGFIS